MNEPKPVTISTLESATEQEVFDWVVYNLRRQGCRSVAHGGCKYRGPNGTRCAAGWLIADDEYRPDWDDEGGYRWGTIALAARVFAHKSLITELQNIHDNLDTCDWEANWRQLAEDCKLVYTPPQLEHA